MDNNNVFIQFILLCVVNIIITFSNILLNTLVIVSIYNIRQIRKFLSIALRRLYMRIFVTSHLDYCNSLLFGLPKYQIKRLQRVLNTAARITCFTPKCSHITPSSCTYTGCLSSFALSLKSHSLFTKLSMGWLLITLLISC